MQTGPLNGIRVIEVGSLIAGPFCGQLLGDLGAEIIKIEQPGIGDPFRTWGKHTDNGAPIWWSVLGRNKRSVTCDLRHAKGQQLLRELVAKSDVLIENFRPGTLARWNLDPESLLDANPTLIIGQVSGFGQTGPYSSRPGYASIGEAMGGLRYVTGHSDRPPVRVGISLGDSLAGIFCAVGVLASLVERSQSGKGQKIDVSIAESVLSLMESLLPDWHLLAYQRERSGPILPGIAPSNVYPTSDGGTVLIAANQDTVFRRLCDVMSMPFLIDDPRFKTHSDRGTNMDELDELIAQWSQERTTDDALLELERGGVPAGRIYRAEDILADAHFMARESITWFDDKHLGRIPMQNVNPKLSRTPGSISRSAPDLGEDTDNILQELLGYTAERVHRLRGDGVI